MMNNLMIAATAFFALGAVDYGYRTLRSLYWDVKDMLRERKWKREADARMAEMNSAITNDTPTAEVAR